MPTRIHKLNPFEDLGIIGTLQNDVILSDLGGGVAPGHDMQHQRLNHHHHIANLFKQTDSVPESHEGRRC